MGQPNDGTAIACGLYEHVDLALPQRPFQPAQKADLALEIRDTGSLRGLNQQVDIAPAAPVVHPRTEEPNLGAFTKALLRGLPDSGDLVSGQVHL